MINIHPAFVHFPIALLLLYTVVEILPLKQWFARVPWTAIRNFLLTVGTVSIVPTVVTGLLAARAVGETALIETHERAALSLVALFIASIGVSWYGLRKGRGPKVELALRLLAVLEFVGLFVVGALGASIVYGPQIDPLVNFVYGIFV
jgi:uncharacterized membrane protein